MRRIQMKRALSQSSLPAAPAINELAMRDDWRELIGVEKTRDAFRAGYYSLNRQERREAIDVSMEEKRILNSGI